jgi:hypothetical protein
VRITVEEEGDQALRFCVVSEARFPADEPSRMVVRTVKCCVRRVTDRDRVRIEVVPAREAGSR